MNYAKIHKLLILIVMKVIFLNKVNKNLNMFLKYLIGFLQYKLDFRSLEFQAVECNEDERELESISELELNDYFSGYSY